ncbi:HAD family hydrolase [Microlunatus elymi]|uniref:HAD family hydrolase n=1 Tax=Microlunatus elymi TaxID=2596828 RepID=UPI001AEFBE22|nr:HAD family hydrolase [Microlunatus elymi]
MAANPSWVFFDVDQTLCDFTTMMRRALGRSIREIELSWPQLSGRYRPDELERIRDHLADGYGDAPVPLVAVRREMFATVLREVSAGEQEIDEVTDHYLGFRFADPVLFPDVLPTLEALSGKVRLGVITNGNSKLDALGLEHFFEVEFVAEQVGFAKPDSRIYEYAAAEVGADPAQLIMVGDSYAKDVAAAELAGWRAVWLRRDDQSPADGPAAIIDPTSMIRDLRQLITLCFDPPLRESNPDDSGSGARSPGRAVQLGYAAGTSWSPVASHSRTRNPPPRAEHRLRG